MLKVPVAGRVKTRLGRTIGMAAAAWWYRHQISRLLRQVGHDPRWRTVLAVSPDTGCGSRMHGVATQPQGTGHLGRRMLRALTGQPVGPVVLIGSDIPHVRPELIARAFRRLGSHDAVLGPADDGGYWLIGTARPLPRNCLDRVRWSTSHALEDTIDALGGRRIALIDKLRDVDTANDLAPREIRASFEGATARKETS